MTIVTTGYRHEMSGPACTNSPLENNRRIEIGVNILNPVQTTAVGMDPVRLKAEFGDRLTFWGGGIDMQSVLPFGTPDEVRAQVKERIRIFAPGGGFVFNPIHNIPEKVPLDNLIAMYEAVRDYGQYPLT